MLTLTLIYLIQNVRRIISDLYYDRYLFLEAYCSRFAIGWEFNSKRKLGKKIKVRKIWMVKMVAGAKYC